MTLMFFCLLLIGFGLLLGLIALIVLLAQVSIQCRNRKTKDDAELNNSNREVGAGFGLLLIYNPTLSYNILYPPTLEPFVVSLNRALQLVIAEGNLPEISVVSDLEGEGAVLVFVDFEDDIGGVDGILDNAVVSLTVFGDSLEIVIVDAVNIGQVQAGQEIANGGVMSTIKGPLHSALIFGNSLEVFVGLIEVSSGSDCVLLLLEVELEIHVDIVNGVKCCLSCTGVGPNGVDCSSLVVHADCVVVVLVDVPECQIGLEDVGQAGDGLLEGRIVDDLEHIWILLVLSHPFILIGAKLWRVHPEEVSIVPRRWISFLHMYWNWVVKWRFHINITQIDRQVPD